MRLPIFLDTDPGIDDAVAIAAAIFAPELDLQLMTTVAGNVSVEKTTRNALQLLHFWNAEIPLAQGAAVPLVRAPRDAASVHGESGMAGYDFVEHNRKPLGIPAFLAIRDALMRAPEPVTLVAIGPLTNIALLLSQCPECKPYIRRLVIMGGSACEPTRFGNEAKTIIHGDALAELKKIPAESVDLIFADPPYNIGKNFDGLIEAWKEDLFIDWLFEVIAECHRVLKKQGSMYIMNSTENMPFIDLQCRKLFTIKSRIVWSYDSSGVQAKKHYGSMYEPILMMVKDAKNYTFNGDAILVEAKTGSQRALIDYRKNPPQPYNHQKVPGNVWDFPRVRYLMDEYENHPTQKPEALLKRIILASSNPGDIVLDPFAGSFTTGAVAIASGRKFIGIEINSEYIKMGLRRLDVASHYSAEELAKVKKRKTGNLSKRSRLSEVDPDLITK